MTKKNAWVDTVIEIVPYYKVTERGDGLRDPNLETFDAVRYTTKHHNGGDGLMYTYRRPVFEMMETDPLFVEVASNVTTYKSVLNEDIKATIRKKFGVPVIKPYEELNNKQFMCFPDPALREANIKAAKKIVDPENETLESFLKRTKKVTRYCQEISCGDEMKVYRSKLPHGKGFYCCREHASLNTPRPREMNVCLNCGTEYESILPEEFCCIECEDFYNLHHKSKQE